MPIDPLPSVIIDPASGDVERAEDIIDELMQVLQKHNCTLQMSTKIGQPNEFVLAKILTADMSKARAIAGIRAITPVSKTWRKIDWTPQMVRTQ